MSQATDTYRFVTFNVCGIKNLLSRCAQWVPERSFSAMFKHLGADIICFQETKVQPDGIEKEMAIVPEYNSFFTCSVKPRGYSGVVFYVKNTIRVIKAEEGLTGWLTSSPGGVPYREKANNLGPNIYPDISQKEGLDIDIQGRSITLDLGSCVVIGLYCPADSTGNMTDYRDLFYQLLDWRVTQLQESGREVVVLGDLNVAREPIDSIAIREALRKANEPFDNDTWKYGSVPRTAVNNWIESAGFHDTTREAHPNNHRMFTCWDQSKNARPANFGSRIDYVLTSSAVKCIDANIMPDLMGSDHCPVYADLQLSGIEPQRQNKLPVLSRKYTSKWQGGVKAFFTAGSPKKSVSDQKSNTEGALQRDTDSSPIGAGDTQSEKVSPVSKTDNSVESEQVPDHTSKDRPEEITDVAHSVESDTSSLSTNNSRPATPSELPGTAESTSDCSPSQLLPTSPLKSSPAKATAGPSHAGVTKKSSRQTSLSKLFASKSTDWVRVSEKKPPLCNHNEPCVLKTCKKPPRKGESFWSCARPHGGTTFADGKYRCKTFIWDSDVKK